jgi:hypothetical protein
MLVILSHFGEGPPEHASGLIARIWLLNKYS